MRTARKRCESNMYHVIARGVGKQILFEDNTDRRFFLDTLAKLRSEHGIELYAWCLMSNHVHMLFHAPLDSISALMHTLEMRYAGHFNYRHARTGTLFQGRFTSVPIESDEQLMQAVRYIHRNPLGAGEPIDNPWSSFCWYMGKKGCIKTDIAFVLELFDTREAFARFHCQDSDNEYVRRLPRHRLSDEEALVLAKTVLGDVKPCDLKALDKPQRDALLVKLLDAGLSARQISRITSIGTNIIYRANDE